MNFSGDYGLVEETIELAEITVVAELPVVQPDISANVANISAQDVESLPLTSVSEVVQLEAGVLASANGELSIRGSNFNEIAFSVDGLSMRDGRNNEPYSTVSYTSIKEMSVQSGGFNAEYGNVRSGLVNIVTKEGDKATLQRRCVVATQRRTARLFWSVAEPSQWLFLAAIYRSRCEKCRDAFTRKPLGCVHAASIPSLGRVEHHCTKMGCHTY